MADIKKIPDKEPSVATPVDDTPKTPRTPADQPAEKVAVPTVSEVKGNPGALGDKELAKTEENVTAKVDATAKSVDNFNTSTKDVNAAKPFVKPEVTTVKAKTPEEAIAEKVEATAKSVQEFNKSVASENKTSSAADAKIKPEVSRVAPLTGELRADPEDDSFVTPGKVPQPPDPPPGVTPPEVEPAPLVISPLTGEVKPADEISYITPGQGRDPSLGPKALKDGKGVFNISSEKSKFDVPVGYQAPLLRANEEAWKGDAERRVDDDAISASLADALRRNKRFQKNLR